MNSEQTPEQSPAPPQATVPNPKPLTPALQRLKNVRLKTELMTLELDDGDTMDVVIHELNAKKQTQLESYVASTSPDIDPDADTFTVNDERTLDLVGETLYLCVTDADGNRLIEREHKDMVADLPGRLVSKMFSAAWELNGLNKKRAEKETEKN